VHERRAFFAAKGVQIAGFFQGSPAVDTGLRQGDVLLELDGKPISGRQDFLSRIARKAPGSRAEVKGVRPGAGRFSLAIPIVLRPVQR